MDDRASATADGVAIRRAIHQLVDSPAVFGDPLALTILDAAQAEAVRADPARFDSGALWKRLRAFVAVRSRLGEDELGCAVRAGVRQYVILGAGLDTFAYRNPHPDLRVFEVDHPATQRWKRERLEKVHISVPSSLTFLATDLRHGMRPLSLVLRDAGLRVGEPSFFSWLGVTPYLDREAVDLTLTSIASIAGHEGGVVFDYAVPRESMTATQRAAFDVLASRVARAGEPFQAGLAPEWVRAQLERLGFRRVHDVGSEELNAAYFSGRSDGLQVGGAGRIVTARR